MCFSYDFKGKTTNMELTHAPTWRSTDKASPTAACQVCDTVAATGTVELWAGLDCEKVVRLRLRVPPDDPGESL